MIKSDEIERLGNQSQIHIGKKSPGQVFSNSLSSFLKVKATKAYEFGEGLVKSITSDQRKMSYE